MIRIKKVLTFSNAVAFIALFVALGGSVYAAGKINGTQIKANSLPGNRVKAKSLPGNRIKATSITGKQLKANTLTGNQINEATLTGVSAGSIGTVYYTTAVATVPSTGNPPNGTNATALCPPGTFVIGGGATLSNENSGIANDDGPTALRTGWTATLYGEEGASMTVTAICTAVKAIG